MDDTPQLSFDLGFCRIPGCSKSTGHSGTARGLCSSHYHKLCRYGDPLHTTPAVKHKQTDLAYVAGFIDADGCILLESSRDKRQVTPGRFVPKIAATNSDRRPIELLHEMFGGTYYMHKRSGHGRAEALIKPRWGQFVWAVSGDRAVEIARQIAPYLRRKRDQALLLCEMKDTGQWSKGGNTTGKQRPAAEIERKWLYVHAMRRLNQEVVGGVRLEDQLSPNSQQIRGSVSNHQTSYTLKPDRFL